MGISTTRQIEGGENMSKKSAKKFFARLEKNKTLRRKIKKGLEKVAQDAGYDVTVNELHAELRARWGATAGVRVGPYSEPPGY
jgi:nitrogen fixation uncharacterized protein